MLHRKSIPIYLLRHGETEGGARYCGRTDYPLTNAGRDRMWASINGINDWEIVISSPLKRCAEFANTLAERYSKPIVLEERLREMDFGEWENQTAAGIMDTHPDALANFWQNPWNNGPPGGETLQHTQMRTLAAWNEIVSRRRPSLVICHGGPIRIILCHAFGFSLEKLLHVEVPHGSLHRVDVDMNDATVIETALVS